MEKSISDNTTMVTAQICINGGSYIAEDMTTNVIYNRRVENNLPFPPSKEQLEISLTPR